MYFFCPLHPFQNLTDLLHWINPAPTTPLIEEVDSTKPLPYTVSDNQCQVFSVFFEWFLIYYKHVFIRLAALSVSYKFLLYLLIHCETWFDFDVENTTFVIPLVVRVEVLICLNVNLHFDCCLLVPLVNVSNTFCCKSCFPFRDVPHVGQMKYEKKLSKPSLIK